MALFAVTYEYTDAPRQRDAHRPEHVAFLSGLHESGRLVVSGPADGGTRALLVFSGESADDVAALLDDDPFRREGLIARRTVSAWSPFFGKERLDPAPAQEPVR